MVQPTPYLTIKQTGTTQQIIKKSEFICNIAPVSSQTEAEAFITKITTEHKKATHNCYAYLIGADDHVQRASDNGEPSGTAGVPILEVLKNNNLHDVCAVVTRYFGGIKLGAGGLIRAYSSTTAQAIKNLGIVKRVLLKKVALTLAYPNWDKLQNYFKNNPDIVVNAPEYTDKIRVELLIEQNNYAAHLQNITQLLAAKMQWDELGDSFTLVDYHK